MATVTLDIDNDEPYELARTLFTIANYDCSIRLSASKGCHMKIYDMSESAAYSIKTQLDDSYRVALDESRAKQDIACTNVLWDRKNGKHASIWVNTCTRYLAYYLLRDSGRSLRDSITNLFNRALLDEFTVIAVVG